MQSLRIPSTAQLRHRSCPSADQNSCPPWSHTAILFLHRSSVPTTLPLPTDLSFSPRDCSCASTSPANRLCTSSTAHSQLLHPAPPRFREMCSTHIPAPPPTPPRTTPPARTASRCNTPAFPSRSPPDDHPCAPARPACRSPDQPPALRRHDRRKTPSLGRQQL